MVSRRGAFRSAVRWSVRLGLAASVAGAVAFALSWAFVGWDEAPSWRYPCGTVLRDSAGVPLRVALGPDDVDCRPGYEADPDDWIARALVASEDGTFWTHCGVRPLSVLRAAAQNLFYRRRISGASTLTMQAVRLIAPHPHTHWEKWKEAIRALKMERRRDKRWILSQVLNRAPFGSNFVGIEAAAQGWFGKGAKELGLGEAAMLAGMIQAPSRFRPDRGYERAIRRRDYVLGRMLALGFATEEQVAAAKSVRPAVRRAPRPFRAPHYCDWRLAQVPRGADVVTALDADLQAACEESVSAAARAGDHEVAAVVLRVSDGEVLAMAVSGDYGAADGGQVNTATCPRPAGSTLKPFLAAFALERGLVAPEERLMDVPCAFQGYRPANFDGGYRGLVTLRDALVLSLNIPFVTLLERVGVDAFADHLRALGFAHLDRPAADYGLGLAIGNAEVTLLELANGYRALAAADGRPYAAATGYLLADMLSGGERASRALGHVADVEVPRFAWKTGTSSAYRDAWTVAWNPAYVIGVWCGHLRGGFGDRRIVGARAAAPVCWGLVRRLYPQNDGPWPAEPPGVVRRRVCTLTGLPATPDCPSSEEGRALAGCGSAAVCGVHGRDPDGRPVERLDSRVTAYLGRRAGTAQLAIARPEDGATFELVPGALRQALECRASGCPPGGRLWWFLDGRPLGESSGDAPFEVELEPGDHEVRCATADGASAAARFTVRLDGGS